MLMALASGVLLGLSAGLAPGPLLALVLAQTLRYGPREGCKVAFSPLLTDAPIIALAVLVALNLGQLRPLLGFVSICGAVFVLYLAWETFHPVSAPLDVEVEHPGSWHRGVLTNFLSPHPWLFWLTVGAATLTRAIAQSWLAGVAFLCGFYALLVGSKVLLALLAGKSRSLLSGPAYRLIMCSLAVLLAGFALLLFREGVRQFTTN